MFQLAERQVLLDNDSRKDKTNYSSTWPCSKPLWGKVHGAEGEPGSSGGGRHKAVAWTLGEKKEFIIRETKSFCRHQWALSGP